MNAPDKRPELDHAGRAADLILAMVVARRPSYPVTPEAHDTLVLLVEAVVAAISSGGDPR
jgi:hypothetical protein